MKHRIITSLDDLDGCREGWESLRLRCRSSIFSSFDLVRLWLLTYHEDAKPSIVLVEDGGTIVGVAPLCLYKQSLMGVPVRNLTMVGYGQNILGYSLMSFMARGDEDAILLELLRGLKKVRWNMMQLFALDPTPSTDRFIQLIKQESSWQPFPEVHNLFYEFPIEGDIASRFGSNSRRLLRKTRKDLQLEGRLQVRLVENGSDAERAMRLYVEQHKERWRSKGGSIFSDRRNAHQLVEMGKHLVENGTGLIHEMLIDGEVAAQSLVLLDGEVARGYRVGMVDRFEEYSPGKLIIMLVMEDLRARGFKGYDHLRGDEEYKHHMKTHERVLPAIQVYRGSLLMMSKARRLPGIHQLDECFGVGDRVLKRANEG